MPGISTQRSATKYQLTSVERGAAEQNVRQLRDSEIEVLALLLRYRDEAIERGRSAGHSSERIAAELASVMYAALLKARRIARSYGLARLRAELRRLGLELEIQLSPEALAVDSWRARVVARSYATRWQEAAEKGTRAARVALLLEDEREPDEDEAPKPRPDVLTISTLATLSAIKRIAATENAEAFTAERETAIRTPGPTSQLAKVWDATLDRKTCPICRDADGTIVLAHESFPLGTPGSIHPFCRCEWSLVRIGFE